jgi:nucleoside-diphosphate-sugar epimerase
MCEQLGVNLRPQYVTPRPGDIRHSLADITKARKCLDYQPDWNFTKGFTEAIEWYQENL